MHRTIVLFCSLCFCFIQTIAQQTQRPSQITIQFHNQFLDSAFRQLEIESGYRIFFQDPIINNKAVINQTFEHKSVDSILDELLANTGYSYAIIGVKIVIYKKAEQAFVTSNDQECTSSFTTGTIIDVNEEGIWGASVYLKDDIFITMTDKDGRFTVPTADPNAELIVTYIGYQSRVVSIRDAALIKIEEDSVLLNEVITSWWQPDDKARAFFARSLEDDLKLNGITFSPSEQYTATAFRHWGYACDNESCPLGKMRIRCKLSHIDGQCEVLIYTQEATIDRVWHTAKNSYEVTTQPQYISFNRIKSELKYGGEFETTTKQEIEDMKMMFLYYPQIQARSVFNADYMLSYPFNMKGAKHKQDFTCGRVIVTGKNGFDIFVYFILTDKSLENLNIYISDFKHIIWFDD